MFSKRTVTHEEIRRGDESLTSSSSWGRGWIAIHTAPDRVSLHAWYSIGSRTTNRWSMPNTVPTIAALVAVYERYSYSIVQAPEIAYTEITNEFANTCERAYQGLYVSEIRAILLHFLSVYYPPEQSPAR